MGLKRSCHLSPVTCYLFHACCNPFIRSASFRQTGGLADVSGALTKALHAEAVDSLLILPLYDQVDRNLLTGTYTEDLEVTWRGRRPRVPVRISDALGAPTYLIESPHYFRANRFTATRTISSALLSSVARRSLCSKESATNPTSFI